MHVIAGKAVAFGEALEPAFKTYGETIIANAKAMAATLVDRGLPIVSGGTDNHLMLVDVGALGLSGKKAERILDMVGITCNKNTIPGDTRPPTQGSGIRLGTPAITSRGFDTEAVQRVANLIADVMHDPEDDRVLKQTAEEVCALTSRFPLPGLDLGPRQ
jgi:glycine hydroxymethyltransferase